MSAKTLFMETTEISAAKTISQITEVLISSGARTLSMEYDDKGKVTGMQFSLPVGLGLMTFALPIRDGAIFKILNGRRKTYERSSRAKQDQEQAERVACRQLLRWVEAQVAMIDTGMAKTAEVFMPYITNGGGRTMFQEFEESHLRMIEAPKSEVA